MNFNVNPLETLVIPFDVNQVASAVDILIMRCSDGFWLDFNDSTFKDSAWTDDTGTMTQDSNNTWKYSWIVPAGREKYYVKFKATIGGTPYNFPGHVIEVRGGKMFTVVSDAGNNATTFKTDLTESVNDYYKSPSLVVWLTGNLIGQTQRLAVSSAFNGTTKFLTVGTAFTATPNDNSRGLLITGG